MSARLSAGPWPVAALLLVALLALAGHVRAGDLPPDVAFRGLTLTPEQAQAFAEYDRIRAECVRLLRAGRTEQGVGRFREMFGRAMEILKRPGHVDDLSLAIAIRVALDFESMRQFGEAAKVWGLVAGLEEQRRGPTHPRTRYAKTAAVNNRWRAERTRPITVQGQEALGAAVREINAVGRERDRWRGRPSPEWLRSAIPRLERARTSILKVASDIDEEERRARGFDKGLCTLSGQLAQLHENAGDDRSARSELEEVLRIVRADRQARPWRVAEAQSAIADLDRRTALPVADRSRLAEARSSLKKLASPDPAAIAGAERDLRLVEDLAGTQSRDYLDGVIALAHHYGFAQSARAIDLLGKALASADSTLGRDHPDRAMILLLRGGIYGRDGNLRRYAEDVLEGGKALLHSNDDESMRSTVMLLFVASALRLSVRGPSVEMSALLEAAADLINVAGDTPDPFASFARTLSRGPGRVSLEANKLAALLPELDGGERDLMMLSLSAVAAALAAHGDAKGTRNVLAILDANRGPGNPGPEVLSVRSMIAGHEGRWKEAASYAEQALEAVQRPGANPAWKQLDETLVPVSTLSSIVAGDFENAERRGREGLDSFLKRIPTALTLLPEAERLQEITEDLYRADLFLSAARRTGLLDASAYRLVGGLKGIWYARRRWERLASDDPEIAALRREWSEVAGRISGDLAARAEATNLLGTTFALLGAAARSRKKADLEVAISAALVRKSGGWNGLVDDSALRAALPAGTALVDFRLYSDIGPPPAGKTRPEPPVERLLAFVVRPDRPVVCLDLEEHEPIREAVIVWRIAAGADPPVSANGQRGDIAGPGEELRRRIWEKLSGQLDGVRCLIVSPDGSLAAFPLAALPVNTSGDRYLIDEMACFTVPTPLLIPDIFAKQAPTPPPVGPSLLLAGNIAYGSRPGVPDRFAPMLRIADLGAIERAYLRHQPGPTPEKLTDDRATEEAFLRLAPQFSRIVLVTHAYVSGRLRGQTLQVDRLRGLTRRTLGRRAAESALADTAEATSGIAMAGANVGGTAGSGDGLWTAMEIGAARLANVDLLVLDACVTGLGLLVRGDAVLSVQNAFQIAGVRTVVGSLWEVGPDVPPDFLAEYFDNLGRGMGKLEALRAVQLKYRNGPADNAHPSVWAVWSLSGDPGDLTNLLARGEVTQTALPIEEQTPPATTPAGGIGPFLAAAALLGLGAAAGWWRSRDAAAP
jgi:hypothetical protein